MCSSRTAVLWQQNKNKNKKKTEYGKPRDQHLRKKALAYNIKHYSVHNSGPISLYVYIPHQNLATKYSYIFLQYTCQDKTSNIT